jgi:D-glycero-D-manno-heptose 1,7-bisphosphate phosphatase
MGKPMILLDRDGVLNRLIVDSEQGTVNSPLHPEQVQLLPGVDRALAELTGAGYGLAIVSNQPAWAKGTTSRENLRAVHEAIVVEATRAGGRILSSHLCLHRRDDGCECRKPKTGLLREVFTTHPGYAREASWIVGDGITDIEAGTSFNLRTAFLGPRKCDACKLLDERNLQPSYWGPDLPGFVAYLLGRMEGTSA